MTLYGKLSSEEIAEQNLRCRQVVRDLNDLGLSQRQLWFVIYLLALELEDITAMQELTACIKELKGSELFLSQQTGGQ
jgi:hypothetical protein